MPIRRPRWRALTIDAAAGQVVVQMLLGPCTGLQMQEYDYERHAHTRSGWGLGELNTRFGAGTRLRIEDNVTTD